MTQCRCPTRNDKGSTTSNKPFDKTTPNSPPTSASIRRRAIIVPGVLFLLGAALLVTGLVTTHALLTVGVIISVAGFLTMTATVALFIQRHHRT